MRSTGLLSVWEQNALAQEPQDPPPEPPPEIDEDEQDEYVTQSMNLMAATFRAILDLRYNDRDGETLVVPFEREDGPVSIEFLPNDEELDKDETADIYSDPDFFDRIRSLLSDFDAFTVGTNVMIHLNQAAITAQSKMDLFIMLSNYLTSENFAMSTPDTIYIGSKHFDKKREAQQRGQLMVEQAARMREIIKEEQKEEEKLKAAGQEIEPGTGILDGALYGINNSVFSSRNEYDAACLLASHSDMPFSLAHIYQTICQDDKLEREDYPQATIGDRPTMGGYN